jgi:hypothetical protein
MSTIGINSSSFTKKLPQRKPHAAGPIGEGGALSTARSRPRSGWPQAYRSCTVATDKLQQAQIVLPGDLELLILKCFALQRQTQRQAHGLQFHQETHPQASAEQLVVIPVDYLSSPALRS